MILALLQDRMILSGLPGIRGTVDTPDPCAGVSAAYEALHPTISAVTSGDMRAFACSRPDLAQFGGHRRI